MTHLGMAPHYGQDRTVIIILMVKKNVLITYKLKKLKLETDDVQPYMYEPFPGLHISLN